MRGISFGLAAAAIFAAALDQTRAEEPFSTFRDCETCPEMIVLPPGAFTMGSDEEDAAYPFLEYDLPSEWPVHEVDIAYSFAAGKYEVTVEEFAAFADETGFETGGLCNLRLPDSGPNVGEFIGEMVLLENDYPPGAIHVTFADFRQPGTETTPRHPAVCLTRADVVAYVEWLGEKTGRPYRLLTEAEWEYAVRAGTDTPFFFGSELAESCPYANFADQASPYVGNELAECAEENSPEGLAPAGTYQPNPWGFHDMLGNALEMLEDCWFDTYDGVPVDGSPALAGSPYWDGEKCEVRAGRSGQFDLPVTLLRSASRHYGGGDSDPGYNFLGFRVGLSLSDPAWDLGN